ncbi:hypothetical protein PQD09_gp53 [Providencia phage PSTCR4]|uniref:Uncharacterized protein n=1 Tax=Providencia phage PSTCR4 TaxID=2783546 RepID=A0A873WT96_9CAUD|nr:hypothetical protein PQD09_gp53 [Providencia phage PSTCR4]QPB12074.1 hypothetical protein [Providencia phage PSTCR4]
MSDKITSFQFDASQHNPAQTFDTLPVGWYVAQVVDAEVRPTRAPGGMFIATTFEIIHPEFAAGRKVWANYNVQNANPQAVEIGMNELAALSISAGVPQFNDVQQLQMRPLHIKLKVTKPKDADEEPRNEVSGYESVQKQVKYATANVGTTGNTMTPPPGFAGQAPNAFPSQPAQQAAAPQGFTAPTQPNFAAPQQPAQPQTNAPQQPANQPWNQQAQQQAPAQQAQQAVQAGTQPWNRPQAPVVEAQPQPQTQQTQAPDTQAAQPAWAQQQVDPAAQAAANAPQQTGQVAQPNAPQEPAHPAQQAPAPWQTGASQPVAGQTPAPWNQPAQQ